MPRFRLAPLALILAAVTLTVAAAAMLFSAFMFYDDEGYVLLSLKNFSEHGRLYREVYSQYGPFPYAWWYALHLCGVPFTNEAGRVLTLVCWSAAAAAGGGLVWRFTRDFSTALATLTATFLYLWVMASEPSHPGGLIVMFTALLAGLGGLWIDRDRTVAWATLAGAGAGALLLTKINVGGFAALAAGTVFLLHHRSDTVRRVAPWLIAAGAGVLPWILMRSLLAAPWVQTYAAVFTLAALPAVGAAALGSAGRFGARELRAALIGGGLVALAALAPVLSRGTAPGELLEGMLLGPLRHPVNFSLRFIWPSGVIAAAGASCGLFLIARVLHVRRPKSVAFGVATLRLIAACALGVQLLRFPGTSPDNLVFAWSAPLLWAFLWPLPGVTPARVRTGTWLGLLFLGQWLHAYPVPGSQIAWGSFLALPLTALGAWESAVWLGPRLGKAQRTFSLALRLALGGGALLLGARFGRIGQRYLESRPLGLPGAETIRLPDGATATYRLLCLNAIVHTDLLFSLPGMFSFNLWTGIPTPTLANATHWFSLLNVAQQRAIADTLEAHPRAGVIVQTGHLDFLRARGLTPHGPLVAMLARDYEAAFAFDGFEFRVRRGRTIAPLQTAEIRGLATGDIITSLNDTLLKMNLLLPADREIASVEITGLEGSGMPSRLLNTTNARVELTPINLAGAPLARATGTAFPFQLRGPMTVNLYFNRAGWIFPPEKTLIVLRDAAGSEVALVRLRP